MSQKVSKRARRRTEDEVSTEFKSPDDAKTKEEPVKTANNETDINTSDENGVKEPLASDNSKTETTNGEHGNNRALSPKRTIQTRSRSNTPLIKNPENVKADTPNETKNESNGSVHETSETSETGEAKQQAESKENPIVENGNNGEPEPERDTSPVSYKSNSMEMEPLILEKDEEVPIPELQFDENDVEIESEGSPSRCRTRRSQTRNMSTPKTPKTFGDQELEPKACLPEDNSGSSTPQKVTSNDSNVGSSESQPDENVDFNDTSDTYSSVSTDNISTRAVAGSDATRNVDFTYQDSGLFEENSYIFSPNRSLGETLRGLSSRRTIRPVTGEDYRKYALKNSLDNKGEMYTNYDSVQRISAGMKRKNRSTSPEDTKRFKKDSPGLLSYFSSPISNFKNTFGKSSTPKLIGYEKKENGFEEENDFDIKLEIANKQVEEKKWCAIM